MLYFVVKNDGFLYEEKVINITKNYTTRFYNTDIVLLYKFVVFCCISLLWS